MNSLDRTADGSARKCDECEREFKGEPWQDYCAECHAKLEENSPLKALWACLTCNETFPVGEVRFNASEPVGTPWPCPRCGSRTITPADKTIRETDAYYGPIGTRN
jgi:DNA-directed RNA polymerase subunit RPC12/RpoP